MENTSIYKLKDVKDHKKSVGSKSYLNAQKSFDEFGEREENSVTCGDDPKDQEESESSIGERGEAEEQPTHDSEIWFPFILFLVQGYFKISL